MTEKPPASLQPRSSVLADAMRHVATLCGDEAEKVGSADYKRAFLAIADMMLGASCGARSPLLDLLSERVPKSGGDVAKRLNHSLAAGLVVLRMRWGDSQNAAIARAADLSGISRTNLARMVRGANAISIEGAPAWEAANRAVGEAIFHNPQQPGEAVADWRARIEEWLCRGIRAASHPAVDRCVIERLF